MLKRTPACDVRQPPDILCCKSSVTPLWSVWFSKWEQVAGSEVKLSLAEEMFSSYDVS